MIPFVMMLTYRVLQLLAGVIHIDRFAANSTITLNYFGGGLAMLVVFGYPLVAGSRVCRRPFQGGRLRCRWPGGRIPPCATA
jgi:hypothetical protein